MDYGYISDIVEETPTGWSFNIKRNEKYPIQRILSKDINTLRVEITYLSGHSLRFKVNTYGFQNFDCGAL